MDSVNSRSDQPFKVQLVSLNRPYAFVLLLFAASVVLAHEDPHHRIEQITRQLEHDPSNTKLYLIRGELHHVASHWKRALADFDRFARLDPAYERINVHRGRLMLDAGWTQRAKVTLDRFLTKHPNDGEARTIRARTLRKLGQPLKAVEDYSHALSVLPNPAPVLFVERAEALAAAGETHLDAAISSVDEAIGRFGPLVVLETAAIDLEMKRNRYGAALAHIDRLLINMPRKEKWLTHRGEILDRAGRHQEARVAYEEALASFKALPLRVRQVPAARDLEIKLRSSLGRNLY